MPKKPKSTKSKPSEAKPKRNLTKVISISVGLITVLAIMIVSYLNYQKEQQQIEAESKKQREVTAITDHLDRIAAGGISKEKTDDCSKKASDLLKDYCINSAKVDTYQEFYQSARKKLPIEQKRSAVAEMISIVLQLDHSDRQAKMEYVEKEANEVDDYKIYHELVLYYFSIDAQKALNYAEKGYQDYQTASKKRDFNDFDQYNFEQIINELKATLSKK